MPILHLVAAHRRRRRARGVGAEVQAPRRVRRAGRSRSSKSESRACVLGVASAPALRRCRRCGRLGLVRGGLGAAARARGRRCPACRRSSTACGSRTSPTSTSASRRAATARVRSARSSGSRERAARTSSRSPATSSRVRAGEPLLRDCSARPRAGRSPCSATTTSRSAAIRSRRRPSSPSSSPATLLVDEGATRRAARPAGLDRGRRPARLPRGARPACELADPERRTSRILLCHFPHVARPAPAGRVRPRPRRATCTTARSACRIRARKIRLAHPSAPYTRRALPPAAATMHVSPGPRDDVRAVPFLRAARGDRARAAAQRLDRGAVEGQATIATDILARYAADAAREVDGRARARRERAARPRGVRIAERGRRRARRAARRASSGASSIPALGARSAGARARVPRSAWPTSSRRRSTWSSTRSPPE